MTIRSMLVAAAVLTSVFAQAQKNSYREVTLPELMKWKHQNDGIVIVDVRSPGEFGDSSKSRSSNIGRIKGAINLDVQKLETDPTAIRQLEPYREREIFLICSHSYRSRRASNILLQNGFQHVNNVRGGMTEWYRRYDDVSAYRDDLIDNDIPYSNMSPSEFLALLHAGGEPLIAGIKTAPKYWWDSSNVQLYSALPLPVHTVFFEVGDSLRLLAEVMKDRQRPVVLFNMVNNGAAELAAWLKGKNIPKVYYLVGGPSLVYEYASNQPENFHYGELFKPQSEIQFFTPMTFCGTDRARFQLIDLRHDSDYNNIHEGVKHSYSHLKNAAHFYYPGNATAFERLFPDHEKTYVFVNDFGGRGMTLVTELRKRGYRTAWLLGGYDRWEWYMNNVENFTCNSELIEQ